jgi:hypothetical protein
VHVQISPTTSGVPLALFAPEVELDPEEGPDEGVDPPAAVVAVDFGELLLHAAAPSSNNAATNADDTYRNFFSPTFPPRCIFKLRHTSSRTGPFHWLVSMAVQWLGS